MECIATEGSSKWTPDSLTDASTLLLALTTTGFLSALVIASTCLNYLLALTRSLQAEAKDIVEAMSEISHVKTALRNIRENVDVYHGEWFAKVERMCDRWVLSHRCLEFVDVSITERMFLLRLLVNTIAASSPYPFSTI